MRAQTWVGVGVAVLWGVAFCLACQLAQWGSMLHQADASMAGRMLSAGRVALGERMYEVADLYFHKGVPHQHEKAFVDFYQHWAEAIAPTPHVHPGRGDVQEIMPWLRFATSIDPHSVEPYLVAAYWIGDKGGRPDLAEGILREAARNNPGDYLIYLERARICMIEKDAGNASRALEVGLRLWPSGKDADAEEAQLELLQLLSLRAFLYELEGNVSAALDTYSRAFALSPGNENLRMRVESLQRGETRQSWAREAWDSMFGKRTCSRNTPVCDDECDHEGHEHDSTEHSPSEY